MKKSFGLLSAFLFTIFFLAPPSCRAESQDNSAATPGSENSFVSSYKTEIEKVDEYPIAESGEKLESEPARAEFIPPRPLPVPTAPVLKVKQKRIPCKDQCNEPLKTCHWTSADPSRGQICNNEFMSCLRKCFDPKK